jgi:hypothetical protein
VRSHGIAMGSHRKTGKCFKLEKWFHFLSVIVAFSKVSYIISCNSFTLINAVFPYP